MADQPTYKVFVSSTYLDLSSHRAHVIQALRGAGFFVDPMEDWPADAKEPTQFSQDRVQGCDLCILLVAFRRGYIPQGANSSITQLEYQAALEQGMDVIVFLLGDEEPWRARFDERNVDPELNAWRAELRQKHGVKDFGLDPASLPIEPALTRWLAQQQAKRQPGRPVGLMANLKAFDFAAFLNEKRRHFTGRQWLFDELERWRTGSQERALLITGDPGIGKSAIVAELVHRNPGGQVLAHHCCRADAPATLQPGQFIRSLAAMIARNLQAYAVRLGEPAVTEALSEVNCVRDPASAFEAGILTPLHQLPIVPRDVCYLLVDALDEALAHRAGNSPLTLVDILAARLDYLPPWLRLVATTRKERSVLDRLRGLRARELDAQDLRNLDDVERYILQRLKGPALAERLASSGQSALQVAHELRAKCAGNFLYAQQALEGIERDLYGFDRLTALPPGLYGLYLRFFERQFPDEASYAPARRVLQVVVAAQEPLTRGQMARAAGLHGEDELPGVLRSLATYLPEQGGPKGERCYASYHRSLADWLTDPELQGTLHYASPVRGHERLADLCWSEYRGGPGSASRYALLHLPSHLGAVRRWDDLLELLCDLAFLEAKAEAGLVFELAVDFTNAVRKIPAHPRRQILALLEEALRADIHFLARHPTCLFQCLWNRAWWYDCPAAPAYYQERDVSPTGEKPAWEQPSVRLASLLESWRTAKERTIPGFRWLRSLRPPSHHLGTAQRAVFRGHEGTVQSVAFSPDGQRIVSGSGDKTVRVWDAASGAELRCLRGHERYVQSVAFSPDGQRIVSGSGDKTVRVWDAISGAELHCLYGHEDWVQCVAFSPNGQRIASGSRDGTVRLWDAVSGAQFGCLRGHRYTVEHVTFSTDGQQLLSGSEDRTIRIWHADSGAEMHHLRVQADHVLSTAFAPDGRRVATSAEDNTVRVWDVSSGAELHCLRGHQDWVESVAFSPDGQRLVTGSKDQTVRLWDAVRGDELRCLRGHERYVQSVAFSPDGRRIASGSFDQTVRAWDADSGAELRSLRGHVGMIQSIAFAPDGRRLASASEDQMVCVWDADNGVELRCLRGHEGMVQSVAFSPSGLHIASGSQDKTIRVWDADSGKELRRLQGHEDWVRSVAFSPDGLRIASGSFDQTVRVWDAASGAEVRRLGGNENLVECVAFSPDGLRIASGSFDQTVRVWDAASGAEVHCLRGHEGMVRTVAFSRDGRRAASASLDQTVRVWDADSGTCLEIIQGGGDVAALANGPPLFPWRAILRNLEIVIESATTGEPVAWFPVALEGIATHPSGRTWAGAVSNYLGVFTFEGAHR